MDKCYWCGEYVSFENCILGRIDIHTSEIRRFHTHCWGEKLQGIKRHYKE